MTVRPGKATSRTPGMHAGEKSDACTVPMIDSNKEAESRSASAEEREGERAAEGHAWSDPPTSRTPQSRERVSKGIAGVRAAARKGKKTRFTALLHHVDTQLLRQSFYQLKRNAATGVDGVTWKEYEQELDGRIERLWDAVQSGRYRAQPTRRVYIPKANGGRRPLGIVALEDKIVQQAVSQVLNAIYEEDFLGFSYGYRPGRTPHAALDAVSVGVERKKVNWVLDADLKAFLDRSP